MHRQGAGDDTMWHLVSWYEPTALDDPGHPANAGPR